MSRLWRAISQVDPTPRRVRRQNHPNPLRLEFKIQDKKPFLRVVLEFPSQSPELESGAPEVAGVCGEKAEFTVGAWKGPGSKESKAQNPQPHRIPIIPPESPSSQLSSLLQPLSFLCSGKGGGGSMIAVRGWPARNLFPYTCAPCDSLETLNPNPHNHTIWWASPRPYPYKRCRTALKALMNMG